MASLYLETSDLTDAYSDSQKYSRQFFKPFDEYERLAANKLRSDLPSNMPKVNDGSLAALLLETPMRVLSQPQTGRVISYDRDEDWVAELANQVLNKRIIPNANTQAPFETKMQIAMYRALQYGAQPLFTFFNAKGEYRGADFTLPYIKDVSLEPGKVSDLDSDYIFLDIWYTKLQIRNFIQNAENEDASAKKEKRESENKWNVANLRKLLEAPGAKKDSQNKNRLEQTKDDTPNKNMFKVVMCFQRGVEAPFYGIAPSLNDAVVYTAKNTNPCGDLPITFQYAFEDLTNPFGKGQIEISGGTQNVLDYMTQLHVLATQIGIQPPIQISGPRADLNLSSIVYAPRQFWFTGQANVAPVETDTRTYQTFPTVYGLYKTQLQNLQGTTDAATSADSGNPGYSKTDAGVKLQQARTNSHDNFLLQRSSEARARVIKNLINIHFANMEGSEVMQLIDDDSDRLEAAGLDIQSANQLEVIWENVRGKFDFIVDPQSDAAHDAQEMAQLKEAITDASGPMTKYLLNKAGWDFDAGEAWKQYFSKFELDNLDRVFKKLPADQAEAAAQAPPPSPNDPPRISFTAQLPPDAIGPALQSAGVNIDPQTAAEPPVGEQTKLQIAEMNNQAKMQQMDHQAMTSAVMKQSDQQHQSAMQDSSLKAQAEQAKQKSQRTKSSKPDPQPSSASPKDSQLDPLIQQAMEMGIPPEMIDNYLTHGHVAGAQQ